MNIKNALLTNSKARPKTKRAKTTKIAIHYVGNPGSSAMANRNYFNNCGLYVSAHYIIGLDGEIIRCVPEDEIAYTTNSANSYSIGIENCHPDWTGKFNSKTYASLVELCADLCKRYKLDPLTDLIRHYDVTKKICPKYFVDHPDEWNKFKYDVKSKMTGNTVNNPYTSNLLNRYKNGTYNRLFYVDSPDGKLSVRDKRPANNKLGNLIGQYKNGDVILGKYSLDNWMGVIYNGKQGFVNAQYLKVKTEQVKLPSYSKPWKDGDYGGADVIVKTNNGSNLNIRAGRPGSANYNKILGKLKDGSMIDIFHCLNGWFSIYIDGVCNPGFISGDYIVLEPADI